MDPFHVVRLAGDALDRCWRRVQHDLHGPRGRVGDPLYAARRTLHTGQALLTDNKRPGWMPCSPTTITSKLKPPGGVYQRMITAYREPDPTEAAI